MLERARRIRLLVLDVDGVLTDGRLYLSAAGEELKVFHVRDGSGLVAVQRAGVAVAIISGRDVAAVDAPRGGTRHPPRAPGRGRQGRGARRAARANSASPPRETRLRRRRHAGRADAARAPGLAVARRRRAPGRCCAAAHWVTRSNGGRVPCAKYATCCSARAPADAPAADRPRRSLAAAALLAYGLVGGRRRRDRWRPPADEDRGYYLTDATLTEIGPDGTPRIVLHGRSRSSSSCPTRACCCTTSRSTTRTAAGRHVDGDRGAGRMPQAGTVAAAVGRRARHRAARRAATAVIRTDQLVLRHRRRSVVQTAEPVSVQFGDTQSRRPRPARRC